MQAMQTPARPRWLDYPMIRLTFHAHRVLSAAVVGVHVFGGVMEQAHLGGADSDIL